MCVGAGIDDDARAFGTVIAEMMDFCNDIALTVALEVFYGKVGIIGTDETEVILESFGAVYFRLAPTDEVEVWAVDDANHIEGWF